MMILYGYWRSTAAYRVRIGLNLKQLEFESRSVHLVKDGGQQHSAEYRALNPQGLVPLLIDGDTRISQSSAILEYLEEKYPGLALLPGEPEARAAVRSLYQSIACDLHPLNNLRVLQYLERVLDVDKDSRDTWYHHWIHKGFTALEKELSVHAGEGNFSMGESLSMVDLFLVPQLYNARRFNVPLDEYPRLTAIEQHCLSLSAFADARPEAQPDAVLKKD